jgi:two-component system, LytTR family, sensor kinase
MATIWFAIGLFDATQTVLAMRAEGMHHAWTQLFITLLLSWLPWAFATPFTLRLGRRYPPVGWRPRTWLLHFSLCGSISLIYATWTAWLETLMNPWAAVPGPGPFLHVAFYKLYNSLLSSLILYFAILAVGYILDSRERMARHQTETARLNEELSKAQLNALRRQIEPHFLFNTLNAISGLVREGRNDAAVTMIVGLSDVLRRLVEDSSQQEVALAEEMEVLEKYLDIQKARFGDRLQLTVTVPKELLSAQVPSLILQPVVENAVKHGIEKRAHGGALCITASRTNGVLTLTVYNDGPGLPSDWESASSGIGVANMRNRLQRLYGNSFQLTLCGHEPGGVAASVSIPFRER